MLLVACSRLLAFIQENDLFGTREKLPSFQIQQKKANTFFVLIQAQSIEFLLKKRPVKHLIKRI
jgi:hypothetical protein